LINVYLRTFLGTVARKETDQGNAMYIMSEKKDVTIFLPLTMPTAD